MTTLHRLYVDKAEVDPWNKKYSL